MHDGTTPLMLAVRLAVEGMVDELINADADVNATDAQGNVICERCLLVRSTLRSRRNKVGLKCPSAGPPVRPPVHPQKVSSI